MTSSNDLPRRVWGALPVFYRPSWDSWGHTRGPVVYLPVVARPDLVAHEVWHVRQFWAALALTLLTAGLFGLWWLSPAGRFRAEAAAYAESVRRGKSLERAAEALAGYGLGRNTFQCRAAIERALEREALF